jgi:hypothetical protein
MLAPNTNKIILTVAVTGHRDLREQDISKIKNNLKNKILELQADYPEHSIHILTGDADGADTLAVQIVNEFDQPKISIIFLKNVVPPAKDDDGNEILDDKYYEKQARYIVDNAQLIIALWDGIYTLKKGGTSEVIRMALEGTRKITIHHLVCPRVSNPFPVNTLAKDAIDYKTKVFNRIPFTVNFSWCILEVNSDNLKHQKDSNGIKKFLERLFKRQLIWYFIAPILLSFITIIFGIYGFEQINSSEKEIFGNTFFQAVNLITLNSSVIDEQIQPGLILHIARFTGLLTIVFTFIYALLLALKDVREGLIRLRWRYTDFILVIGLSKKSLDLIKSLSREKRRIVILTEVENSVFDNEIMQIPRIIIVRGSISSATMLSSVYALSAKKIFIMSDNDSKNVRAAQELDIMSVKHPKNQTPPIFVHLLNDDYTRFLRSSLSSITTQTCIFNIYENTVRRLFLHYPPDRFYQSDQSKTLKCFIIGFDEMGKEILLTLLKQGHYENDKRMEVTVYCKDYRRCKVAFQKQYPGYFAISDDSAELKLIKDEVWNNIALQFVEIPQSENQWLRDDQPLFKDINNTHIINVYAGLTDGIEAASHLNTILPKLNYLAENKGCNTQVFCYYNFPDKKEEGQIENYFNKIAPQIFVKCFGNFLDECSSETIQSMALDELAKLINSYYNATNKFEKAVKYNLPVESWPIIPENVINAEWSECVVKNKISNRQASDHLWTKLRIIHSMNQWNYSWKNFTLSAEELKILGEIEHRRWSAELLLQGFVPFDITTDTTEYRETVEKWSNRIYKGEMQSIKRHINLVPFGALMGSESEKDYDQIKAIPYFLFNIFPSGQEIEENDPSESRKKLAFLLYYAARIDNSISESEKEIIRKHLQSEEEWHLLHTSFENEIDLQTDQLTEILRNSSVVQKKEWLEEIKILMQSDGRQSETELYLLKLMERF